MDRGFASETEELFHLSEIAQRTVGLWLTGGLDARIVSLWSVLAVIPSVRLGHSRKVIASIIVGFANHLQPSAPLDAPRSVAGLALEYIWSHRCARDVTLSGVARQLGLSRGHLSRRIGATGVGFYDYLHGLRVIGAVVSMASTPVKPIKVIAIDAGYLRTSDFDRHFRRILKMTPSDFRHVIANCAPAE
jgi:AraC-like DNA-binding protein